MALVTKPYTFSAGGTILSAEVNSDFDTLYADHNGGITNANISASAAIVDTKLAQITTASKVSGAALTSLGSIPQQTTTTGNALLIDSDTLTTGRLALFDSNSSDTGTRELVRIVNDNTAATGATCFSILQDAAQNAMLITHTAATGNALAITASQTTANIVDISCAALTQGKVLDISNLDAITTGKALHVDATGVTHTDGILVHLDSASTAMTATGRIFLSDHTGNAGVSTILNEFKSAAADETIIAQLTASAALAAGKCLNIIAASMTTGTAISMPTLNALSTGSAISITSDSADASARSLVYIKNDNTSATAATALEVVNDAPLGAFKTTVAATSTNYFKVGAFNGVTLWVGNGTGGNGVLSATAGDILFNGASNKPEYCTGTNVWVALV